VTLSLRCSFAVWCVRYPAIRTPCCENCRKHRSPGTCTSFLFSWLACSSRFGLQRGFSNTSASSAIVTVRFHIACSASVRQRVPVSCFAGWADVRRLGLPRKPYLGTRLASVQRDELHNGGAILRMGRPCRRCPGAKTWLVTEPGAPHGNGSLAKVLILAAGPNTT
jgi:hypothetical protein